MLAERDLIFEGLAVVHNVARGLARRLGRCVSLDDMLGMGNLALVDVVREYDPARGPYGAYVATRIKWAILDGLRRETHGRSAAARVLAIVASERYRDGLPPESEPPSTLEQDQAALTGLLERHAAALAFGLLAAPRGAYLTAPEIETPEEQLSRAQTTQLAQRAVRALPERERVLMERYYYGGEPFDAIARDLGISKSWACRLHNQAIDAIHEAMHA
jgi:RNA polymerase sigma factor for flagellar operon FliA